MPVQNRFKEKLNLYKKDAAACKAIRKRLANAKGIERLVVKSLGCSLDDIIGKEKSR